MIRPAEIGLQGEFILCIGHAGNYRQLSRFHYTRSAPASYALIVTAHHATCPNTRHVVGVGVLSNPTLSCGARETAMRLGKVPREWRWRYLNRHLRTISRVIVHPQYRGVGLSSEITRCLIRLCPTRYVEAISHMATHHPLFECAGMRCVEAGDGSRPAYFLHDSLAALV